MQRWDDGWPELDPGGGVLRQLVNSLDEGGQEGLTFPAGASRKEQVSKGGAGIAEHVHVHIEIQRLQGCLAPQRVPMAEEQVAPECDQGLYWVRVPGQDG